jgi:hypothetical protein
MTFKSQITEKTIYFSWLKTGTTVLWVGVNLKHQKLLCAIFFAQVFCSLIEDSEMNSFHLLLLAQLIKKEVLNRPKSF